MVIPFLNILLRGSIAVNAAMPAQTDGSSDADGAAAEEGPAGGDGVSDWLPVELTEAIGKVFEGLGWGGGIAVVAIALAIVIWLLSRFFRMFRRRRPPGLHPKLQQYGGMDPAFMAKRHAEASRILATSSTGEITGYTIIRQVEAVFVDGFRRAEDALEGVKAAAAMKGANGVTNVRHERGNMGRWSAAGDAVVIQEGGPQPEQKGTASGVRTSQVIEVGPVPEADRYRRDEKPVGDPSSESHDASTGMVDAEILRKSPNGGKRAGRPLPPPDHGQP